MDEKKDLVRRDGAALEGRWISPTAGSYLPGKQVPREPQLRDYWIVLRKHQWLILSIVLSVVTLVAIASFKMRPVYVASSRIEIAQEESSYLLPYQNVGALGRRIGDIESYIETRAKVLQGETLALMTIDSLGLERHPDFAVGNENENEGPSEAKTPILQRFLSRLSVGRIPNTRLLQVSFDAHDPRLAARIVNAHIQNFIEHNFQIRYESTMQASGWLANQLGELRIRVEQSEDVLIGYERENQIWSISEKQNITTQKLGDINRELTLAQSDRMQKQSYYEMAQSGNTDAIAVVRDSAILRALLEQQAELEARHTEAQVRFGPKYPEVLRLQAQLQQLNDRIEQEKQDIIGRIESEYLAAKRREELLRQALEEQKAQAHELAKKMVQYNILKREAETNKELYNGLLQRIKEAGISAGLRSSNIRVVDRALVPSHPARPRKAINIALAFLLALMGGIFVAFIREALDNTVKTPDDVEHLTRLPSLAVVPEYVMTNARPRLPSVPKMLKKSSEGVSEPSVALASHVQPKSAISEAFRALRTSLLLSQADRPPQIVLVTSPLPLEGKTTTAVNLAVTLAQLGDQTLLIDGDLRKPGVAKTFALQDGRGIGLSSYLAGSSSVGEMILKETAIPNLAVLPSGVVPPNPAELLSSERLRVALTELCHDYKFIIIDSPPVLSATDAVILSVLADYVVLVIRSGFTPKDAMTRATSCLVSGRCKALGILLNGADLSSPYYSYSYKYYSYGSKHEQSNTSES